MLASLSKEMLFVLYYAGITAPLALLYAWVGVRVMRVPALDVITHVALLLTAASAVAALASVVADRWWVYAALWAVATLLLITLAVMALQALHPQAMAEAASGLTVFMLPLLPVGAAVMALAGVSRLVWRLFH